MRRFGLVLGSLLGTFPLAALYAEEAKPPPSPTRREVRGEGDSLRQLCATWQPDQQAPLLEAPLRLPPLSYEAGELRLQLDRPVAVDDGPRGLVEIFPGEADEATARIAITEGARLVRAQAEGKLLARIAFYPERNPLTAAPCLLLGGGRVIRVRVQPLWVSLLLDGREQGRLYTERGEAMAPTGRPDVLIEAKEVVFDGEKADMEAIQQSLQPLRQKVIACYQRTIGQRAGLSGKLIVGMDLDREGRVLDPRVEVDAIGDAGLARCVREVFLAARVQRLRRGGHLSVPMSLRMQVR